MQLTRHTDFALRTLLYVGLQTEGERVSVTEIGRQFNMSHNHLIKVVHKLGSLGYLDTVRGKNGGVMLGKPAESIVIGQVVTDFETTLCPIDCEQVACPIAGSCQLFGVLNKATRAFMAVLNEYTLADFLKKPDFLMQRLLPSVEITEQAANHS